MTNTTTTADKGELLPLPDRITEYLSNGGLFNPEMADHANVRDLLIDCRDALANLNRSTNEGQDGLTDLELQRLAAESGVCQTNQVDMFSAHKENLRDFAKAIARHLSTKQGEV